MRLISFIFIHHFRQALLAALLSMAGVLLSYPVVRWDVQALQELPLWLFRNVLRLLGVRPGLVRLTIVIFCFNSIAIFLYMATGVRPLIPALIALCTGFNIAVILFKAREGNELSDMAVSPTSVWYPGELLARVCGIMVIVLELPCFWYSIAMGMGLGKEVSAGLSSYAEGLAVRGSAYGRVIVPMLLLSALCESVAILGMRARGKDDATKEITDRVG